MPLQTSNANHPDFNLPWIQQILASPDLNYTSGFPRNTPDFPVSNSIFKITLATPSALKARLNFNRPSSERDATAKLEDCMIASLGDGLDGATGRAHGGISSMFLDQVMGTSAQREAGGISICSTATMTVDYKNPVATPTVIFLRSWATQVDGRKIWTKGVIEDGKGKVYATGKALFIVARPSL